MNPIYLDCGKCPWNINGIHEEVSHYTGSPIWEMIAARGKEG
jgi:hypothetical protein